MIHVMVGVRSCLLFVTPWTVVHQAPLSLEFSRQEYWSVLPFPTSGDLPNPGIKPMSPTLQADEPPGKPTLFVTDSLYTATPLQIVTLVSASCLSVFCWDPK